MQQYLDRHRFLKGIYLMVRRYFDHHVGRDSAALTYYLMSAAIQAHGFCGSH